MKKFTFTVLAALGLLFGTHLLPAANAEPFPAAQGSPQGGTN